jgi:hypothetical protein
LLYQNNDEFYETQLNVYICDNQRFVKKRKPIRTESKQK